MTLDVLVVDDDFMVARVHAGFVDRTPGFRVVARVHDGASALEAVEQLRPDVVLLDVHLPDVDGLSVLREIRARHHQSAVLVVTAERGTASVRAALHDGAMHYLVKPFAYDDLRSRLEHVAATIETLRADAAEQEEIDRAFGAPLAVAEPPVPLPKGLSRETATAVSAALSDGAELSARECGEVVGISRVSARRYLEHFVRTGGAEVRLRYGEAGRPERLYHRLPADERPTPR